jgi:hypothetical protein
MIATTGDLISFVLRASGLNGVGQTPLAEDSNTCLDFLRMLMAQWQRKRWLVWAEQEVSLTSTGADSYTIGPGQAINTARPDKIQAAFVRLSPFTGPNAVDIPLAIIEAHEDWAGVTVKELQSLPAAVFYDSAFPVGSVYFWPVPTAAVYQLHLVLKVSLPVYTGLTDALNLPPEYIEALIWSLSVRMQMAYGMPARPDHVAAMKQAINVIQNANSQIPLLSMPAGLVWGAGDASSWSGRGLSPAWTVGGPAQLG